MVSDARKNHKKKEGGRARSIFLQPLLISLASTNLSSFHFTVRGGRGERGERTARDGTL